MPPTTAGFAIKPDIAELRWLITLYGAFKLNPTEVTNPPSPCDPSKLPVPGARPRRSEIGASFALPHLPAKVPSLNVERPLGLGGANWPSCPLSRHSGGTKNRPGRLASPSFPPDFSTD